MERVLPELATVRNSSSLSPLASTPKDNERAEEISTSTEPVAENKPESSIVPPDTIVPEEAVSTFPFPLSDAAHVTPLVIGLRRSLQRIVSPTLSVTKSIFVGITTLSVRPDAIRMAATIRSPLMLGIEAMEGEIV